MTRTLCSDDTRRHLLAALRGFRTDAEWCREVGVSQNIVSDAKNFKSMSPERENVLRRKLGLDDIVRQTAVIHHDERITKKPGFARRQRNYVEFKVRVPADCAPVVEAMIEDAAAESFSQLWRKQNPDVVVY